MWFNAVGCIMALALSLLAAPLAATAQPPARVPQLGLLIPGSASAFASRLEAFRQGLHDLGYLEGQNIALVYRFADGRADQLPRSRQSWSISRWTSW